MTILWHRKCTPQRARCLQWLHIMGLRLMEARTAVSIAAQAPCPGYVMASDLQSRTLRVRGAAQHDLPTGQH
jgi:hypothetical protein